MWSPKWIVVVSPIVPSSNVSCLFFSLSSHFCSNHPTWRVAKNASWNRKWKDSDRAKDRRWCGQWKTGECPTPFPVPTPRFFKYQIYVRIWLKADVVLFIVSPFFRAKIKCWATEFSSRKNSIFFTHSLFHNSHISTKEKQNGKIYQGSSFLRSNFDFCQCFQRSSKHFWEVSIWRGQFYQCRIVAYCVYR